MKHFFLQTHLFWILTKFMLAIAGIGGFISMWSLGIFRDHFTLMANGLLVVYGILLGYSGYADIRSIPPNTVIRLITGTLSVVSGLTLLLLIFLQHVRNPLTTLLMALWVIVLGLYEWAQLVRE